MTRPVDLHTAMRRDLIVILKDVVALIARIDACIPIPVSDSAPPPRAVPAGPPTVDRPRVQSEDMPIPDFPDVEFRRTEIVSPQPPPRSVAPVDPKAVLIPAGRTTPAVKSRPLDPRPGRVAGVTITAPGKIVAVDMENFVIACPGGDWQTSRPVALIMERMKDGDTFGHDVLADLGSMSPSTFAESKHRWAEELAKRGVEFVSTKGVGCKIKLAETQP